MRKSRRKSQLLRTPEEQDEVSAILARNPFDHGTALYAEWARDEVGKYDLAKRGKVTAKELDEEWHYLSDHPDE